VSPTSGRDASRAKLVGAIADATVN